MKKIITLLLLLGSIFSYNNLSAQTKTPYEKKIDALTREFLKDIGLKQVFIDDIMKKDSPNDVLYFTEVRQQLSVFARSDYGKLRVIKFEQDVKNAEKLKNEIDFQRDREKNKAEEEKKQEELLKKESERKKMLFNQSDYVKILKSIKQKMDSWLQKGEFEKTEDYQSRISNYQSQFDSICFKEIYNEIISRSFSSKNNIYRLQYNGLNVSLERYDADKEEYTIKVKYGDCEWINILKMNIEKAKIFKEQYDTYNAFVHPKDWEFCDFYLMPIKITLINKNTDENIILQMNNQRTTQIVVEENKLNIKSLNKNYTFDYSNQFTALKNMIDNYDYKTKQLAEKEKQFNILVSEAHNIAQTSRYGVNRKSTSFNILLKDDVIKEVNEIINLLEQALNIKKDENVVKELDEYKSYLELIKKK